MPEGGKKKIRETKSTCTACGHVWYYGKTDELQAAGAALQNAGKAMMCCTGCIPAIFIPNQKVIDLNKCPKCNSKAITKQVVEHEVP
jgi:ssDNA-binding Zn-finger/Zn-ribbon topoisomerase 1